MVAPARLVPQAAAVLVLLRAGISKVLLAPQPAAAQRFLGLVGEQVLGALHQAVASISQVEPAVALEVVPQALQGQPGYPQTQQVAAAAAVASMRLLRRTVAPAASTFSMEVMPILLPALRLEVLVEPEIPRDLQHFLPWLQTALLVVVALVARQAQPGGVAALAALMAAAAAAVAPVLRLVATEAQAALAS